jgi:hypothetical protein
LPFRDLRDLCAREEVRVVETGGEEEVESVIDIS